MFVQISFVLLVSLALVVVHGFQSLTPPSFLSTSRRHTSVSMLFGGGKKASKQVTITADGKVYECGAGPVNLRKELMANKVDVYPLKAKITGNCGGAGICGTCAVKVLSGSENINPPSANEKNTLKGKPADFRLSCCARVSGPISIKTKP